MSNWYCPLPFRHAYIDSAGVSPCCQTSRNDSTLDDWPNHPYLKSLQKEILEGKIPQACHGCVSQEATQGRSLRTDSISDYNNQIFTDTKIDFIDYRSSNICNFKCRSCNPMFSHGIAREVQVNSELKDFYPLINTKTVSTDEAHYEWIINNLDQIKRLMFTGGEPTVIPGIKLIIEEVLKNHADTISILITSNASFSDPFWYEITERIPNLHWTLSIDAVGKEAEVIRHGTDWKVVEKNARWLATNAASLDINTVVSNLNTLHLMPLLKFTHELQLSSISPNGRHGDIGCRHQFFVCNGPNRLSAINWPNTLVGDVVAYLNQCLTLDLDSEQRTMLLGLLRQIQNNKFDPYFWNQSTELNSILDKIRNEDHTALLNSKTT